MRRVRQSLIVNNFFTLASIIIISVTIAIYSKYIVEEENSNLLCENPKIDSYKVVNQKLLNTSIKALDKGYYKIDRAYIQTKKAKTVIKKFISKDEIRSYIIDSIKVPPKKESKKYLSIRYELVEFESKPLEEYHGGLKVLFKAGNTEIFRYYTKINFFDKKKIASQIACMIRVYKNNVKKF